VILLRHFSSADAGRVKQLHASQALDYELPDLEAKSMLVRCVIETDGEVEVAAFLRKTAEAYLLFDPLRGSRKHKLGRFLAMHKEVQDEARRAGFDDVHCWLPPELDTKFGKLLMHLGWKKPLWTCYSREVG
jgi:hypothetical protein